jgi:hypothetical protein
MLRAFLPLLLLLFAVLAPRARAEPPTEPPELTPEQQAAAAEALARDLERWPEYLEDWYERVGGPRPGEPFGELVVRAARAQMDKPYRLPAADGEPESLYVDLGGFECVSLVEAAVAVARCSWVGTADQPCFESELTAQRYRGGRIDGWGSRLHYFSDWLEENERQGHIALITGELGGEPKPFTFDYMSKRPHLYPALADPAELDGIVAVEQRLSAQDRTWIPREGVAAVHDQLQNGDIVAIVGTRPGLFIRHVGLIDIAPDGRPRLLHASSLLKRVTVTKGSISSYVNWNEKRLGVVIARPLAPERPAWLQPGGAPPTGSCDARGPGCTCVAVEGGEDCFPSFAVRIEPLSPRTRQEMTGVSWREGCPVHLDDLRLLTLSHWTLDGRVATGELVVAASVAPAVARIFESMYRARSPVARMDRIDRFGGSDDRSMAANNTSAFNCRTVAGTRSWSQHAYGVAIDINPLQNPWVRGSMVDPPGGAAYLDRAHPQPGMLVEGDPVVSAFDAEGWYWGGRWSGTKDYQHFSVNGR